MTESIYPYLLLFILNFIEGSIITLGAGISLPLTNFDPPTAITVLILADIVSDMVYYSVGRFSGNVIKSKYLRIFGINDRRLKMVRDYYNRHGKSTLFIAKMSDILAMPAILLAGFIKMNIKTFIIVSVVTSIIKSLMLFGGGFLISSGSAEISAQQILYVISGLSVLTLTVLVFKYNYQNIKRG